MTDILHLSDLHLVKQSSWNNIQEAIFEIIREKFAVLPTDQKLIVITGDFHNFYESDYKLAKEFISKLVKESKTEITEDVFVIPGNHDMHLSEDSKNRRVQLNNIKVTLEQPDDLNDEYVVEMLIEPFGLYSSFVRDLGIYDEKKPDPASVHVRTWRNKLNILHTNTALVADGKPEHKNLQLLDIYTLTGEKIREKLSNKLPTIVLGHNSFYDLQEKIQVGATALFIQKNVRAYLAGDQHRFNESRRDEYIHLRSGFSRIIIPNIICAKLATDSKDHYSDFGFIIHHWDEKSGNVDIERYSFDIKKDQDKFRCEKINNLYNMKHNENINSHASENSREMTQDFSALKKKYQNYIKQQCSEIELSGLPGNEKHQKRVFSLDRIFVPLSFEKTSSQETIDGDLYSLLQDFEDAHRNGATELLEIAEKQIELIGNGPPMLLSGGSSEIYYTETISIENLIPGAGVFRMLILGDPGAGKTTLLKLISSYYGLGMTSLDSEIVLTPRNLFPIWIRCKDIKDENTSIWKTIESIPIRAEWGLNESELADFKMMIKNQIEQKNVLLLIDGLDEIMSDKDRRAFAEHLKSFANENKDVNIIITSRQKGFSIVSDQLFREYDQLIINPLNPDGIRCLCLLWNYLVYGKNSKSREDAKSLSETILKNERLRLLATNPLLLTTLLLVERRLGRLPTKRAGLYSEYVKVLLETWNSEQHERIELAEAMYQLGYIAFWMSTNSDQFSGGTITKIKLQSLLEDIRREYPNLFICSTTSPTDFINIIERRSAILIRKGVETAQDGHAEPVYEFQHLTLQEYLAAHAVYKCYYPNADPNDRDGQVLAQYLTDSSMKEIIHLTAAMDPHCADFLSREVLDQFNGISDFENWKKLKAMLLQFVSDEISIKPEIIKEIFNSCFIDGVMSDDKSVLKQIADGGNGVALRTFFEDYEREFKGYRSYSAISRHLSGEVYTVHQYKNMINSNEPKTIAEGLALLNTHFIVADKELSSDEIELLSNDVFRLLSFDDDVIRTGALDSIRLMNPVKSEEQLIQYINAWIDTCNKGQIIIALLLEDFRHIDINVVPAGTIHRINIDGFSKLYSFIKKSKFYNITEYREKITYLAFASIGNVQQADLNAIYTFLTDYKQKITNTEKLALAEANAFLMFLKLIRKFDDTPQYAIELAEKHYKNVIGFDTKFLVKYITDLAKEKKRARKTIDESNGDK